MAILRSVVEQRQQEEMAAYYAARAPVVVETVDAAAEGLDQESVRPKGFAEWFAVSQTLLPALLLLPGSQAYRLPLRVGAYAISFYAFALWWLDRAGRKEGKHPAERYLLLVMIVLTASIAHPDTVGLVPGIATVLMYFTILCPLFWARAYVTNRRQLVRVLAILIVCNGINSIVGVLQVYDPARWMPRELSMFYAAGSQMSAAVTYVGPGGRLIMRPPGLFDTPGAVCGAGTIAAMFGLIFALEPIAWWKRLLAFTMAGAGIAAIYLSHVRVSLVVAVAMMTFYLALLAFLREHKRFTQFGTLAAGILAGAFVLAVALGGQSILERFSTLLAEDPATLYYNNRGVAFQHGFTTLLAQYPMGAGLARWGMMHYYFGAPSRMDVAEMFAEVQPSAWVLDGGVFLLAFYCLALVATVIYDAMFVRSLADPDDRRWSAAVIAANFGTLVLVFTFVPFGTVGGMQFWFLEGALHGAMVRRPRLRT
jgi:hypothetical protein